MTPRVGFVLVAHNHPRQLLRLVLRLISLYDNPPLVCHFDFSQSSLEVLDFPRQVQFVRPHISTKWGHISYWLAFRAALQTLYETSQAPEWFVLLSGSDYPTQPPSSVLQQLETGGFDAYLDHRRIRHPFVPDSYVNYEDHGFGRAEWIPLAYDRYVAVTAWLPGISLKEMKPIRAPIGIMRSEFLVRPFTPFSSTVHCFGGDGWITGNRKTAERILAQNDLNRALLAHYSTRAIPEESLTHTILCNQTDLRISADNLRYADWTADGAHPKILRMEDLPAILASKAHFARKFDLQNHGEVLDAIDQVIGEP